MNIFWVEIQKRRMAEQQNMQEFQQNIAETINNMNRQYEEISGITPQLLADRQKMDPTKIQAKLTELAKLKEEYSQLKACVVSRKEKYLLLQALQANEAPEAGQESDGPLAKQELENLKSKNREILDTVDKDSERLAQLSSSLPEKMSAVLEKMGRFQALLEEREKADIPANLSEEYPKLVSKMEALLEEESSVKNVMIKDQKKLEEVRGDIQTDQAYLDKLNQQLESGHCS